MDISVTSFKHNCLKVIRRVETTRRPVAITRRGKVVARLHPSEVPDGGAGGTPWERLRRLGGRLVDEPHSTILHDKDFEASR